MCCNEKNREVRKKIAMTSSDIHSFGALLKLFRKRKGLTQQQIATAIGSHRNTVGRWEQGDFCPENKRIVLELARYLSLNNQETHHLLETSFTALSPYWYVPYQRNPFFTGREDVLCQLTRMLGTEQSDVLSQATVLSGLGGVGKTQTAIEYAYRFVHEYTAVFWINAETTESLLSSTIAIAHLLDLPEIQEPKQDLVLAAVTSWLSTHGKWLLILDNVEDLELVKDFLPSARSGSLLFLTRQQTLGITSQVLNLEPMTSEEGMDLLLRRARQPGIPLPDTSFPQELLVNHPMLLSAAELVTLLGGLPLALDQAGAYIEETGCGVAGYLQRYCSQRKDVLARRGRHGGEHPASVATTLVVSVQQIEREHPAAAELLRLCAFLHPEAIPEDLFITGISYLGALLAPVVADPYRFDMALAALRSASLVARFPERGDIAIHRLVQVVLQDQMDAAETRMWCERVVRVVHAAFPGGKEFKHWAQCERYLVQAVACAPLVEQAEQALREGSELLFKTGNYLMERGRYREAEPLLAQAISLGERQYGPDHAILIPWMMCQAELFWRRAQYDRAEQSLQHILSILEQQLEPDCLQIAETLGCLAGQYSGQGKHREEEVLLKRSLAIYESHPGPIHPRAATMFNNLATLYYEQGRYEEAELLYQRALALYKQSQEPSHSLIGNTLSNLATLYREQGRYREAEPLYHQALTLYEQSWELENQFTSKTLSNLATLYRDQGKYEQAEPLYQRALELYERYLEPGHPKIALVLYHLARLRHLQEQVEQAEWLYRRALAIDEQRLGIVHPQTVKIRHGYSQLLHELGRAGEITQKGVVSFKERQISVVSDHAESSVGQNRDEVLPFCPVCQNAQYVVRSGVNRGGTRRFRCQNCQRYFTPDAGRRGYDPSIKARALLLAATGRSAREIAQQLAVHHSTVSAWMKEEKQ
jgi:tetratricopeptide (TPR) repeat protein/transposase-like protein/transcriptional regulator with XRE-family HTH domain